MDSTHFKTQIVRNPHKGNTPCMAVFGVDTIEMVDSYSLAELENLIFKLNDALDDLRIRTHRDAESNQPTLF
jgi:hypothetical protein